MKGINIMYGYRGKIAGVIITIIGAIAMTVQKLTDYTLIKKLNSEQHFNIYLWVTLVGLFTVAFSKEKHEDERVQHIRARSFAYSFFLMCCATLAFAFSLSLGPSFDPEMAQGITVTAADIIETARFLMFYPAVAIVIYLAMFHIGLYYDQTWDYKDEAWSFKLLWKNKRYKIAFILAGLIIIELIFRLFE